MISIEKKIFESEKEFVDFIKTREYLSTKKKKKIIEHERAHFNKAIELGYSPKFRYYSINIMSFISLFYKASIRDEWFIKDLPAICLAPKNPGVGDRIYAVLGKIFGDSSSKTS